MRRKQRAPRTRLMEVLRIFQAARRPLSALDLSQTMAVPDTTARQYLCRLRKAHCLRFVYGSNRAGRYFEPVPGATPPPDARSVRTPAPVREASAKPSHHPRPTAGTLAAIARKRRGA